MRLCAGQVSRRSELPDPKATGGLSLDSPGDLVETRTETPPADAETRPAGSSPEGPGLRPDHARGTWGDVWMEHEAERADPHESHAVDLGDCRPRYDHLTLPGVHRHTLAAEDERRVQGRSCPPLVSGTPDLEALAGQQDRERQLRKRRVGRREPHPQREDPHHEDPCSPMANPQIRLTVLRFVRTTSGLGATYGAWAMSVIVSVDRVADEHPAPWTGVSGYETVEDPA